MTTLSQFRSKLGEHGIPFYKILHKVDGFRWDEHAAADFIELKQHLKAISTLVHPSPMMCCCYASPSLIQLSAPSSQLNGQMPLWKSSNNLFILSVKSLRMLKHGTHRYKNCFT
jgi:hypothetical protein